ncbi:chemotaxis protein CheW [Microbacteriaceae bacterium 4G12]
MSSMDHDLLRIFLEESQEHLQSLNENVLVLETDPANIAVVNEIFRSAHTFKGMSATMGFTEMADLTHKMENVLDEIRNGRMSVTDEIIDIIFECIDNLEKMVADVQQGGRGSFPVAGTTQKIAALMQNNGNTTAVSNESTVTAVAADAAATHRLHIYINKDAMLKAVRAIMCTEALSSFSQIVATTPSTDQIEKDEFDYDFLVDIQTTESQDEIYNTIMNISDIESIDIEELKVENIVKENTATPSPTTNVAAPKGAVNSKNNNVKMENRSIRVQLEKIEKLMNMFEESVIERGRINELAESLNNKDLIEHLNRLGDISKDLQNVLLNMRMVPIETVFNRFPRMVRSLAKELGKKIELQIVGEETEVDKIVIDEIGDPLVHLIRNAIDHGIEKIEERKNAGKQETGHIKLEAFHSGNNVVIQISDDGHGINKKQVLEKAIKKGLVSEATASKLTDREIYDLIFQSGFSTAEVVSDLSGRGVGLDVVKHTINALGGHLITDSEEGKGSTFRIELPLTLSIIQSMLIKTNNTRYAIPLGNIVEAIRIDKGDLQNLQGRNVLNYRDQIIEIMNLSLIFGEQDTNELLSGFEDKMIPVLIVKNNRRSYGLIVNTIIGQREIVLKSLGDFFSDSAQYFSGATILGDGRVVLILNPEAL